MPSLLLEREREWVKLWELRIPFISQIKEREKKYQIFFSFWLALSELSLPTTQIFSFSLGIHPKILFVSWENKKKHKGPDSPGTELKSFSFRSVSERDKDSLHPALQFLADGAFCNLMWERSNCYCRHCSSFFCLRF